MDVPNPHPLTTARHLISARQRNVVRSVKFEFHLLSHAADAHLIGEREGWCDINFFLKFRSVPQKCCDVTRI